MKKKFANTIAQGCLIAAFVIIALQCAFGQWNNAAFFDGKPKAKALDWSDWCETWDYKQMTVWASFAVSGICAGAREAYHADPYVFERRFGAGETSFWGSDAWKRNYFEHNPEKPHKHQFFGNVGRDVWHTTHFVDTWCLAGGTFVIGGRKHPLKYRIANLALGMGVRWLFQNVTYESLRF